MVVHPPADSSTLAGVDAPTAPPLCPRCGSATPPLPASARFCPRCGSTLCSAAAPQRFSDVTIPFALAWQQNAPASPAAPAPDAVEHLPQSQIVVGYANAMYNLGWRYERGRGTHRNPDEAVRCYHKAAKLGNAPAAERIGRPDMIPAPPQPPPLPYDEPRL